MKSSPYFEVFIHVSSKNSSISYSLANFLALALKVSISSLDDLGDIGLINDLDKLSEHKTLSRLISKASCNFGRYLQIRS